jgi:hypothetical protein
LNRFLPRFLAFAAIFNLSFFFWQQAVAQKLSGQWIGSFNSKEDPAEAQTEYVLEFDINGSNLNGYSYTYFPIAGKRYFVICKLKGSYDQGSKSLIVTEVEKIKSNTPPDFQNCLQTHKLTYFKQGDKETLEGKWTPAEKGSNCGTGNSLFERKMIEKIKSNETAKKQEVRPSSKPLPLVKKTVVNPKPTNPVIKTPPNASGTVKKSEQQKKLLPKQPIEQKPSTIEAEKKEVNHLIAMDEHKKVKENFSPPKEKISNRVYKILKTIDIDDDKVIIDIYDNGQIDGDTISIYLNDKLIVSKKMLTAKPINIQLNLEEDADTYDIIMFAENLGTIPPNTALMIVQTKDKRYEINITSTEQSSGAVRFRYRK